MSSMRARGTAVAIAVMAGVGIVGAPPASADVRDVDSVSVVDGLFGKADFGSGGHSWGQPEGAGTLTWDVREKGTVATLTGRVYWDDLGSGGCARVKVTLYDTSGAKTTAYSDPACRDGGGSVVSKPVHLALKTARAHKVVVTTQTAASETSPFSSVRSETRYFGQVNGRD